MFGMSSRRREATRKKSLHDLLHPSTTERTVAAVRKEVVHKTEIK